MDNDQEQTPPQVSTQDYIDAIKDARDNGRSITINFSSMPEGVAVGAVRTALSGGLHNDYQDAISQAALKGKSISLDFSQVSKASAQDTGMMGMLKKAAGAVGQVASVATDPLSAGRMLMNNAQQVVNQAPMIGGIAGGLVGGVPGAALGGAAGEAMKQVDSRLLGQAAPTTSLEAAKNIGVEGGLQGAYELGGKVVLTPVLGLLNLVGKPVSNKLSEMAVEAVKKAQDLGMPLSPAEKTGSKMLAKAEEFLMSTPGGADLMEAFRKKQIQILQGEYDKLLNNGAPRETLEQIGNRIQQLAQDVAAKGAEAKQLGTEAMGQEIGKSMGASSQDMVSVGQGVQDELSNRLATTKTQVRDAYAAHAEAVPKSTVISTDRLANAAATLKSELEPGSKTFGDRAFVNKLNSLLEEIRTQSGVKTTKGPDGTTLFDVGAPKDSRANFQWAYQLRQELGDMISHEVNTLPNGAREVSPMGRRLTILKNALEQDLTSASESMGGKLADLHGKARAAHASRQELINNPVLQDVLSGTPDQVVGKLIGPNSVSSIRGAKALLGDSFAPIKNRYTAKLLGDGYFDPAKVTGEMRRIGDETLTELYGKDGVSQLKDLVSKASQYKSLPATNDFVKMALKKDPQNVVPWIIQRNSTENIQAAKRLVGEQKWGEISDTWVDKMLRDPETSQLSPGKAKELLKMGDDTLFAAVGAQRFKDIKALASIQSLMKDVKQGVTNTSASGRSLISAETIQHPIRAAIQRAATKAYMSPAGQNYLVNGAFQVPQAVKPTAQVAGKVTLSKIRDYLNRRGQ